MSTQARLKAERQIIELISDIDKSGRNEKKYKKLFSSMSDKEFVKFMKDISDDNSATNLTVEIDTYGKGENKPLDLKGAFALAKKYSIPVRERIIFNHHIDANGKKKHSVSTNRFFVVRVMVRRLQQMLIKKNKAVSDTDLINPLTGQVTGDSKGASINDTQTFSLIARGLKESTKEFLGPRADDEVAKMQFLSAIERYGEVDMADLNMSTRNKQSLETMKILFQGVGIDVTL